MMKKTTVMMLALLAVFCLVGCDKNSETEIDNNVDVNEQESTNVVEENNIDENAQTPDENIAENNETTDITNVKSFPKSYTFETYSIDGQELIESGEYTYPGKVDNDSLLPIKEKIIERNIIDSYTEEGVIYTFEDITLENGKKLSVLYLNNATTSEYVAASVNSETDTTLYSFYY